MSFYSLGKSVTLSSLDSRVTTLMADILSALPAPSGIPVATTSAVIVSNSPSFNGQYDKFSLTLWGDGGNNILVWDSPDAAIPNRWSLQNQETNFITTHPTWSDQTQIPISGWIAGETITAA
jgi:hypothetical protein